MPSDISEALYPKCKKHLGGITMKKMICARIGIVFYSYDCENLQSFPIILPEGTEILSVSSQTSDHKHTLWIQYIFPIPTENIYCQRFHFIVAKCNYTSVTLNKHKYLGTVTIDSNTFAVFYEEEKVLNKT